MSQVVFKYLPASTHTSTSLLLLVIKLNCVGGGQAGPGGKILKSFIYISEDQTDQLPANIMLVGHERSKTLFINTLLYCTF